MTRYVTAKNSPVPKDRVTKISVSTIDSSYALADTYGRTLGAAFALLRRVKGVCKVVDFGTG